MPKNIDRLQRRNNIPFMGNVYVERERGIYIDEFIKSAQMCAFTQKLCLKSMDEFLTIKLL